jgi:serine/threonine-protein kinase
MDGSLEKFAGLGTWQVQSVTESCTLHDIGPDYLVMEYVDGTAIKGPLPVEQVVRLAIQIAGALDEAHRSGILHRDLKPGNILVTTSGATKLLDFGLAKLAAGADSETASTIEGTVMGTPAYMSPEQAQGKPVDARSDIFSFGVVLYEIISGNRPFEGTSTAHVLSAVLRDEPKPLQTLPQLERIVMRCLAKRPAQRFQTIAEVKAALEQVAAKPAEQQPSIAVLPFVNMSGDKEQEYFSDGLAEEIINALAQISGLKVTARTSAFAFRGKEQDITKIAEALRVRTILEGSVRKSGNRIRVTAQLINAADGYHLWSQRFDREMADIFAIQDEIAQAIAGALQVRLSAEPTPLQRHTPNLPAYEAYLRGQYYRPKLTPESQARSKECFEQAIALDPKFALAHSAYADHFLKLAAAGLLSAPEAMHRVREEAQKALEIDPSLPEAQAMMGIVAVVYDYDPKEAKRRFRLAMAHDPVSPQVRAWYGGFYLGAAGRFRESEEQFAQVLKDDPLNLLSHFQLAYVLVAAGKEVGADEECRKILELDENFWFAYLMHGVSQIEQEKFAEALTFAEKAYSMAPWSKFVIGLLAGALVSTGNSSRAEVLLQKLRSGNDYGFQVGLAYYHYICGELDSAADWAEKAIQQRDFWAISILLMKRLWSHPRWPALARLMNLAEEVG